MKMIIKRIIAILYKILYIFKIRKNKIVICNFYGKGYGDNPKYICEELLKQKKQYDIVWLCKDLSEKMPSKIRKIKYKSIKSFFELATARVWIDNCRKPFYISKRKGQYYIQTWHGGIGMKKVEESSKKSISKSYIENAKKDSKNINVIISNSTYRTEQYKKNFWYDGTILEIGSPRNDFFFHNTKENINKIKEKLNINKEKKVILYAPTFRNYDYKYITFDIKKLMDKGYEFLIRMHPSMNFEETIDKRVKDVTNYPDVNELMMISDIIISDYSSIIFDYIYTKGDIYLYAPDYKKYVANRGLNFEYSELPFSKSFNGDELIEKIVNNDAKNYKNKINDFLKKLGIIDDGNASKRLAKLIQKVIEEENVDYEEV